MKKEFKLFLIYLVLTFLFIFLLACEILTYIDLNILKQLGVYFVKFVMFASLYILCFVPTGWLFYLIFKYLKNKFVKIFSVSFLIPVTIFAYYIFYSDVYFFLLLVSFLISILMLFVIFIPKKICAVKKEIFITSLLTFLLLIFEVFIFIEISAFNYKKETLKELSNFDLTIKYIKDYKGKNNVYPQNIDFIKSFSDKYPNIEYETFENQKDFILKVYKNKHYQTYNYCSSEKYEGCHEVVERPIEYSKLGDWIEKEFID